MELSCPTLNLKRDVDAVRNLSLICILVCFSEILTVSGCNFRTKIPLHKETLPVNGITTFRHYIRMRACGARLHSSDKYLNPDYNSLVCGRSGVTIDGTSVTSF